MAKIRVVACLFIPYNCRFVFDVLSENCVYVTSTNLQFSGKLNKLRLSFLLCNYVIYRRIFWQSMVDFYYLCRNSVFEKITKVITVLSKMVFRGRNRNQTVFCQNIRLYVLKLRGKN